MSRRPDEPLMGRWGWTVAALLAGGCCLPAGGQWSLLGPQVAGRMFVPAATAVGPPELPPQVTTPQALPVLDGSGAPVVPRRQDTSWPAAGYWLLSEEECLRRAAAHDPTANTLDAARQQIGLRQRDDVVHCPLPEVWTYYLALERRNVAAAVAGQLYHQLAALEVQRDLTRQALAILEPWREKARAAQKDQVPFPFQPSELELQRQRLLDQWEQAELAIGTLNIELKQRLGLPAEPLEQRIWPQGDFRLSGEVPPLEQAVAWAMADRPELRGWRRSIAQLDGETWERCRLVLGEGSTGSAGRSEWWELLRRRLLSRKAALERRQQAAMAAAAVRQQWERTLAVRERQVADEVRVAVLALEYQTRRVARLREQVSLWDERLAEAKARLEARQPGADVQLLQVQLERLAAVGELAAATAQWHQARIRLRAAIGWYAWDFLPPAANVLPQ